MLVANKIDLFDKENVISEEEGKEIADRYGIGFFQTSAKAMIGVKELFVHAVDLYMEKCENTFKMNLLQLNIILVGESMSGKTSIINAFFGNDFEEHTEARLDVSDRYKNIISTKGTKVTLKILDTAGTEGLRKKIRSFYKSVNIVLIAYDITLSGTFREAETYWIPEIKKHLGKTASKYLYNK